ncbi:MAG: hypothetical protein KME11_04970 [Timaviella obliquedivisa GSE-PSE-MK23-08B]|jgi:hypothetical protein|nr:hypothetical protein [Timaviella obliquedivisa GSE-PSE-MK23-08B]
MTLFSEAELIDLINEVGQVFTLEIPGVLIPGDRDLGVADKLEAIARQVRGYIVPPVTPKGHQEIAVKGGNSQAGEMICYLAAHDMPLEDFKPGCRLVHEGKRYSVVYQMGLRSRGAVVLHQVVILPD